MATVEEARKKALQAAVASLCVEVGFVSIDRDAFQVLSQIVQACKPYRMITNINGRFSIIKT